MKVLRRAEQAAVFPVGGGRFVLVVNRGEEGGVAALAVQGCVVDGQVMVGSWRELKRPGDGCFEVSVALKVNELHNSMNESPVSGNELHISLKVGKQGVYSCREKREKWTVYYEVFVKVDGIKG